MADPAEPLILGYDHEKQAWSEGDITAKVRSLTEPDRAVPLTARLEVAPDILVCLPDYAEKDTFRAHVSLKPDASLPADDQAQITIIADPVMELGLQVMSAAGGMALGGLFKGLRAQVKVLLVPYCLRIQAQEQEVTRQLSLEGDPNSPLVLQADVYRVDGGGRPTQPASLSVSVQSNLQGVKLESLPSEQGVRLKLSCEKPQFSNQSAGSLTFTATLPGGRPIKRTLAVELKGLSAELEITPSRCRIDAAPPQLVLSLKNSQGKPVSGLATEWQLTPAAGRLSSLKASTDASGQIRLNYQLPSAQEALNLFTGPSLALSVAVSAQGQQLASRDLTLDFFARMPITVSKPGFATTTRSLELTHPGGANVVVAAAVGGKEAVAFAQVVSDKLQAQTNAQGAACLGLGQGAATPLEISLELDQQSQDLQKMISNGVTSLKQDTWSTAWVGSSCDKVEHFVRYDYVARLAGEKPEDYQDTQRNLKALWEVLRVGQLSMSLFQRRYERFRSQLSSALGNLAGAFYTWLGEKYFPRMGDWLGKKARRLLRYLAGKISGSAWVLARARGAVGTLRGWVNTLAEKLQTLKQKVGAKRSRLPEGLDQKLNHNFDLPVRPGVLAPGDEALKAVEEAARKLTDARKLQQEAGQAYKLLEKEEADLRLKLAEALGASTRDSAEIAVLRQKIGEVGSRAAESGLKARQAQQALEAAEQAEKAARTSLEDLKHMCAALDELLAAFMQALSKLYEYGAWTLAYLVIQVGAALMTNMRTVTRGVHPNASAAMDSAVEDLVTKQAFTLSFELGGYYMVGPVIYTGLMLYQGYSLAVALEEAQALSGQWGKRDPEVMKAALRWWYEDIDAASFTTEENEVWVDLAADLADWLEWLLVWITRLVNLLLGVIGAVVSLLSLGAALPAWAVLEAGFIAFMEGMDRYWDIVKAVGRSGTALMGAAEVWGVVLPAHGSFTAKLYGDDSLLQRLDRAWTYGHSDDLRAKLKDLREHAGTFPGEAALEAINTKMNELSGTEDS